MKNIAYVYWSLDIDCPECGESIDISNDDDEGHISTSIFNNSWDRLIGRSVMCPVCGAEFDIDEVST
jgi:C4-type Zn-finger protein